MSNKFFIGYIKQLVERIDPDLEDDEVDHDISFITFGAKEVIKDGTFYTRLTIIDTVSDELLGTSFINVAYCAAEYCRKRLSVSAYTEYIDAGYTKDDFEELANKMLDTDYAKGYASEDTEIILRFPISTDKLISMFSTICEAENTGNLILSDKLH